MIALDGFRADYLERPTAVRLRQLAARGVHAERMDPSFTLERGREILAAASDSFALTDLIAALEQEFSIKVPDSDLNPRKFDNLARIEAYVSSRL